MAETKPSVDFTTKKVLFCSLDQTQEEEACLTTVALSSAQVESEPESDSGGIQRGEGAVCVCGCGNKSFFA